MNNQLIRPLCAARNLYFMVVLLISSLYKASFLIGSATACISGFSLFAPVITGLGFSWGPIILIVFKIFFKFFSSGFSSLPITLYLPTISSMVCIHYSSVPLWAGISTLCIFLFVLHPVGYAALPYALFWLIPIICSLFSEKYVIARMLGVTFIAHAVGSVMWLYLMPMTAEQFLGLIPVVIVERLIMALIMTLFYNYLKSLCIQFSWKPYYRFIPR